MRSGLMSEDYTVWLLSHLPEGATEIYFHPCADPATAVTNMPRPSHRSYSELVTLTSPRVRAAVKASGAELVTG